jgi:hypothetical protein
MSNVPQESSWPFWHWVPDGQGSEDQCSVCFGECKEEAIEPIMDLNGHQQYACPQCYREILGDLEE